MKKTVEKEILKEAKALLEKGGWCQNRASCGSQRCLSAAIEDACIQNFGCYEDVFRHLRYQVEYVVAHIERSQRVISIPVWNDRPGRTLEEVYAVLDEAIRRASDS